MRLFKVLESGGKAIYANGFEWSLPTKTKPGKWMPKIEGELSVCQQGYHLCRKKDLIHWLHGPEIYEAEYRGEILKSDNKVVVREARLIKQLNWTPETARIFASDCAYRALPIFEKYYPNDNRPRKAIEAARQYARGEIGAAARAAARDAAGAAARAAAWDACAAAGAAADAAAYIKMADKIISLLEEEV